MTREQFAARFGARPVFGMVHLMPLPGSPLYAGSMRAVIDAAVADAHALEEGGCAGVVVENFGDRPFFATRVPPETIAAITRVIAALDVKIPIGVNVLRNDPRAALGIAAATGAAFIRVNVHTGAMVTDQGIIQGEAAETLRARSLLGPGIAIFADVLVKHAAPLGDLDPILAAKDLRLRGLADALIVTGAETGGAADPARIDLLRSAVDAPLIVGSGVTAENAASFAAADGAIVGTSLKRGDRVEAGLVRAVVRAFQGS